MRASGIGLQLDPGGAVARPFDHAIARPRGQSFLLIDMHFLTAGSRLLGDRQFDHAILDRGYAHHQRPIDLARGAAGKGLGEMGGGAAGARQARCHRLALPRTDAHNWRLGTGFVPRRFCGPRGGGHSGFQGCDGRRPRCDRAEEDREEPAKEQQETKRTHSGVEMLNLAAQKGGRIAQK